MASSTSAAARVFAIPELLENILLEVVEQPPRPLFQRPLPGIDIFGLKRVSHSFYATIVGSPALKRMMYTPTLRCDHFKRRPLGCPVQYDSINYASFISSKLGLAISSSVTQAQVTEAELSWRHIRVNSKCPCATFITPGDNARFQTQPQTTWGEVSDWMIRSEKARELRHQINVLRKEQREEKVRKIRKRERKEKSVVGKVRRWVARLLRRKDSGAGNW